MSPRYSSSGMSTRHGPKAATVEDYISGEDEDDTIVAPEETSKEAQSKARHKPPRAQEVALGAYAASDSGYSSHAAATAPSSESKGAAPATKSPKLSTSAAPVPPPPPKRRSTVVPARTYASQPPTRSPPDATLAAASRRATGSASHERCNCAECLPSRRRSVTGPLDTPWNINYPPFDTGFIPANPSLPNAPRPRYEHEIPAQQASRPPLVKTYSSRPARPMSYHEGTSYSSAFMVRVPDASLEPRYAVAGSSLPGPPVAFSAHQGYPLPTSLPPPRPPYPTPLTYADSRPVPQRWVTEQHPPRPVSMYGPPLIEYDGARPPTAAPVMHRRPSNHERSSRRVRLQEEEDYFRMPPPPPPVPAGVSAGHALRPGIRHQNSGGFGKEPSRPRSKSRTDQGRDFVPDGASRAKIYRGQSEHLQRRPSLSSAKSEKRPDSRNDEFMRVEMERRRRRPSYYEHEASRNSEHVPRDYRVSEVRTTAANLEVPSGRGSGAGSRTGSESGSQNNHSSNREGGETRSRPLSGIAVSVPDSEDNFTMKFASGAGVKFDFTGGLEGRTVSLKPGQDGEQAELSIGSRKGSAYFEPSPAQLEYSRSGRRRELEDGAGADQSRSSTRSRRSSRVRASSRNPPMF